MQHECFGCEILAPDLRDSPCTSRNGLLAASALPDTDSLSLHCVLAAERAYIAGVLCDFHLLYLLSQGGTVSVGIVSDGDSSVTQERPQCCCRNLAFTSSSDVKVHTSCHIYRSRRPLYSIVSIAYVAELLQAVYLTLCSFRHLEDCKRSCRKCGGCRIVIAINCG